MEIKQDTTLNLIDEALEASQSIDLCSYLRASSIGDSCERKLWYGYNWTKEIRHKAKTLRIFETGHLEEERIIEMLKSSGLEIIDKREDGSQYFYSAVDDHFGGHNDGSIRGLPEAPKTWHILEIKTSNEKSFKKLLKEGCEKSKPVHYAQIQTYMGMTGAKRAFYLVKNKNNDELYAERLRFDKDFWEGIKEKAERIIYSRSPQLVFRVSNDPEYYECKWCDYHDICYPEDNSIEQLNTNCRTCKFSEPRNDGKWYCKNDEESKDLGQIVDTKKGCNEHTMNLSILGILE